MRFITVLFLAFSTISLTATDWYVRPGVWTTVNGTTGKPIPTAGVYGLQDGTSYANAWNGITSITYGSGAFNTGDTLYVCGMHVYRIFQNAGTLTSQAVSAIGVSGVTIRFDYPGDAGLLFGGNVNTLGAGAAYIGPDVNGVFHQTLNSGATAPPKFYWNTNDPPTIERLKQRSAITWTDHLGGQFLQGTTNYVQLPDGFDPTTNNVAQENAGWAFDLNNKSNITFRGATFVSAGPGGNDFYGIRHTIPSSPYTTAAKNITFTNCVFRDSRTFYLYSGEDDFSFYDCEFARCENGIYTIISATTSPQRLKVWRCNIHDMGTTEYPHNDSHAIGIQGGSYHSIKWNTTSNTGPAIDLWTGNVDMKTNEIAFNYIQATRINGGGGSSGIAIEGDNSLATFGKRTGNKIYGNIINGCDVGTGLNYQGAGIFFNCPDYLEIYNNTITNVNIGIDGQVAIANSPVSAKIVNNIIARSNSKDLYLVGTAAVTNLTCDYNLFYTGNAKTVSPSTSHDLHSITNNPLFASGTPSVIADFKLQATSPALRMGTSSGYTVDALGCLVVLTLTPDIGALQYAGSGTVTTVSKPTRLRRK